ncbi:segmentation protein cap'n'collar isoform X2 [Palaemon carinicauda]|uniref:segmentation protein cap'n'collar isoform X2 n=1 Tax=Palaemon carinicauda TaxID=392227 RepID=UPI0035B5D6E4
MEGPIVEELPLMRSLSPSTVFGEHVEVDYSQTLIKDPTKIVEITPSHSSQSPKKKLKLRKKSPEDLALIEALWKQDVDLGVPREVFDEDSLLETLSGPETKDKDHGKEPKGDPEFDDKASDGPWLQFNFTVDSETGEPLLQSESPISGGDVTLDPVSPLSSAFHLTDTEPDFNLEFNLDEALKLVGLNCSETGEANCSETGETVWKDLYSDDSNSDDLNDKSVEEAKKEGENTSDIVSDDLDDMIQASQFQPQHPRAIQGRLGSLVRSGEMERWQEVVQYLGLPNPHQSQAPHTPMAAHTASPTHPHGHAPPLHHPQALYPSHDASPTPPTPPVPRGVLLNNATLPPPMSDPMTHNITYTNSMGASSHLVTSSMNLTNSSDLAGSDHNQYKMEVNSSLPTEMMYYQNSNSEMNQTTDGLLSSIFNDEALMEMAMTDYSGNRNHSGDYSGSSYRYPPEDPHRMPPVPLKKQHKFGRDIRYFHDNVPHGGPAAGVGSGSSSSVGGDVSGYGGHYPPPPGISSMEGATALDPSEMKFSCTMDFRSQGEVSGAGVDHVQHNHTYHLQPEGSSGLTRPTARDKQRNRKNEHERALSRDEKRARAMNLPITCDDIINLPMDEFNERISKYDLTEAQLSLIRDIRRRGKNKVAAQNCRKRKLDQILHLADEVKAIQTRKNDLCNEFEYLSSERTRIKHKFSLLYRHIFQSLRDPDGNPYSPHEYSLQQSADGSILLVPRSSHSMDPGSSSKPRGKDDGKQ